MLHDPTHPSLPLGRRGMWGWEPADYFVSPADLRALGVSWVVLRAAASHRHELGAQLSKDSDWRNFARAGMIARYQAEGIAVGAFVYPVSDTEELAIAEANVIESVRMDGADFCVLDCEEHYEEEGGPLRAQWLFNAICEHVDETFPLADAPWAFIESHPRFRPVVETLAPRVFAHMPQLYTTAFGFSAAKGAFDRYNAEWRKHMAARPSYLQRPTLPIFGIFDRTTPHQPQSYGVLDPADLARFEERYGQSPVSYWSLSTATEHALSYLRDTAPALAAEERPDTTPEIGHTHIETHLTGPGDEDDDEAPITLRGEQRDPPPSPLAEPLTPRGEQNTLPDSPVAKKSSRPPTP